MAKHHSSSKVFEKLTQLRTRFALISFHGHKYPHWFEMLLLFFEYIQLISQSLLFRFDPLDTSSIDSQGSVFRWIVYFAKLMNPSCLVSFSEYSSLARVIMLIVLVFTALKYLLFVYIAAIAKLNRPGLSLFKAAWRWVFKLQSRVIFYLTASLWANLIIYVREEKFFAFESEKNIQIGLCLLFILLEFGFSFLLETCFTYVLPTKNFLSSRNNSTETTTLMQKLLILILNSMIPFSSDSRTWTLTIIINLINVLRNSQYLLTLPFYNLRALFFNGYLLAFVTSLDLASFLQLAIDSSGYEQTDLRFMLTLWGLLALLLVVITHNFINSLLIKLATGKTLNYPRLLIQKMNVIKKMKKAALTKENGDSHLSYFMNKSIQSRMIVSLDLKQDHTDESLNEISAHYFDSLLVHYSRVPFVKLFIARFYAKKLKLYGKALKLLEELKKMSSLDISLNTSLLIHDMQTSIKQAYEASSDSIDLSTYIRSQDEYDKLKAEMMYQADLQINILQQMKGTSPDAEKVTVYSKQANIIRNKIEKKIKALTYVFPEYFNEPLLLCANYQSALNHSFVEHRKCLDQFNWKTEKFWRHFQSSALQKENFYQSRNVVCMLSAQKTDAGKIVYCNHSIRDLLGSDSNSFVGSNISSLFLPKHEIFNDEFFRASTVFESGSVSKTIPKNLSKGFLQHYNGHMIEVNYYINIYPILNQGFFLSLVLRKAKKVKDMLLISETGDILGVTEKLGDKLNINLFALKNRTNHLNIKLFSDKFSKIHAAMNPKNRKIEDPEVEVEYQQYINDGFKANFVSNPHAETTNYRNFQASYEFHCRVVPMEGDPSYKLVFLDEVQDGAKGNSTPLDLEQKILKFLPTNKTTATHTSYAKSLYKSIATDEDSNNGVFTGEEKDEGWIDFKALQFGIKDKAYARLTTDNFLPTSPQNVNTTEANVFSPASQKRALLATSPTGFFSNSKGQSEKKRKASESMDLSSFKKTEAKGFVKGGVASSVASTVSNQKRVAKVLRSAITVPFYSKFFKYTCLACYALMIIIGIARTYVKFDTDTLAKGLEVKKNILINAQLRTYYLSNVQSVIGQLYDLKTGRLQLTDLGMVARTLPEYEHLVMDYLNKLSDTNKEILRTANALDKITQETLFYQDVKMYDTTDAGDSFLTLTSFQGSDRIIDMGQKLLLEDEWNTAESLKDYAYLIRNCVNDLYIKNNEISQLLLEAGQTTITRFETTLEVFLLLQIALFICLACGFLAMVWKQYFYEKLNMTALMKLRTMEIQNTLLKATKFRSLLKENQSFEKLKHSASEFHVTTQDVQAEKSKLRNANFFGTRKRYLIHTILGLFYIAIIGTLVAISLLMAYQGADKDDSKITLLNFAYRMSSRVNIAILAANELPIDSTTLIENYPVEEAMLKAKEDIISLRTEITRDLVQTSIIELPGIREMLYNDGCSVINITTYGMFCNALSAKGIANNLIGLMSTLETTLTNIEQDYTLSSKDPVSLKALELKYYEALLSVRRVSVAETLLIGETVNQNFLDSNKASQKTRDLLWVLFLFVWIGILIIFWHHIFKKLGDIQNDFKLILQTLPIEVILSSFLLKNFLIKCSKGLLDSVKNHI